jgi:class 3 adenylate cyclase
MTFEEILDQTIAMLRRRGRLTYRALQRQFALDDAYLEDLKAELIQGQRLAVDEEGAVLVWTGSTDAPPRPSASALQPGEQPGTSEEPPPQVLTPPDASQSPDAERRQLTIMFCDLVDSTPLASQLDPEELREVVRAYHKVCTAVITQFDGHIAQLLGDGLLIYFGYPQAHEDDARRAVQSGLRMVAALGTLNLRLEHAHGIRLAIRVGIHTGLVVVGAMGEGRQEQLALGETPNVAARIQGLTTPDTVVISEATARLVQGYFTWQDLGPHALRGVPAPLQLYRVLQESGAQSRLDATMGRGLTPLVGRAAEVTRLLAGWHHVKGGRGQVLLLRGEGGMGKSRLVQVLKDQAAGEASQSIEWRCLPDYQHSALFPVIAYLQRALGIDEGAPSEKLRKLEGCLAQHGWPLVEVVPLFAALLSIPLPASYPRRQLTPQQQRQQTLAVILRWLLAQAAQQPVLFIIEDLHWIDPSTLEFLNLVVDHGLTARMYSLFTFRPTFTPPWTPRAHLMPMTLSPLSPSQTADMVERVARGKALPEEVQRQIVLKTDGIPLAVEELTKMLLESGILREQEESYVLTGPLPPLAIPSTLHDALMARLDRLASVKAVAQLGATIGRTFAYALLRAVAPFEEATLQIGLRQLVEAELLYQHGVPPQATYLFKHALIQEAAYQSLLRSTRQQYHQRLAQALAEQFPHLAATQPELLAHHYTEAGQNAQAVEYWQQAGQQATARAAYAEAATHCTRGLEVLQTLPETPARQQQELTLLLALGGALLATKGYTAPDVGQVYGRARALCQHLPESPQLAWVLRGLSVFHSSRGEHRMVWEIGLHLLTLAAHLDDPVVLLDAHRTLGTTARLRGDLGAARDHLEDGIVLYERHQHHALAARLLVDPGVACRYSMALVLQQLGYPAQALRRSQEALALGQALASPLAQADLLAWLALFHLFRREGALARARAETVHALASEHCFPGYVAAGIIARGAALVIQGQAQEGLAQIRKGLIPWQTIGFKLLQPCIRAMMAEAYGRLGQPAEGLRALAEAQALMATTDERFYAAEIARLQGELLLQAGAQASDTSPGTPPATAAERCFHQALEIARLQQARWWELRTALSLARLWQQQGKQTEARQLLGDVYGWFTEGFDTADLQEARALLEA